MDVLVYGQSGTGKTTFASTFPGPVLWLVCSGGSRPGELKSIDTAENRKRITPRIVRTTAALSGLIASGPGYATVVLDHASGLQDLTLKEILGIEELPAQKSWGMASQQQYGQSSLMCKEVLRALLGLPTNVVIIAQERTFGGDEGGSELVAPTVGASMTPSVTGWLNPACDYVVQTFKRPRMRRITVTTAGKKETREVRDRGVEFCLRTGPHDVYMTKFRCPRGVEVPDVIVDPSYEKMRAIVLAARG